MKEDHVSVVIPSFDNDVPSVLRELKDQSIDWWDCVIAAKVAPAARARNLGAGKAQGKYLIFLDDDVKFNSTRVLEDVIETMKSLGHKDAVGITWRLTPRANWLQRKLSGDPLFTFAQSGHDVELSWRECGAACFAIRSEWFAALGGFDEDLLSGEDYDLAYRIIRSGGKIHTLPHCWIEHDPSRTIKGAIKKAFWYERGNAQVARKHPEADYRINLDRPWKAIVYLLLRTIAFVPLMFLKVNYRQQWPKVAFRPFETFLSYIGAWAYVREWLFPSQARIQESTSSLVTLLREETNVQ